MAGMIRSHGICQRPLSPSVISDHRGVGLMFKNFFQALIRCLLFGPPVILSLLGCGPPPKGNAPGAATIDELLQVYLQAHQAQDVTMLHDVLLWHGPIGGVIRGFQEREKELASIFKLELEEIVLVELEWKQPPHNEGYEWYVRPEPAIPGGQKGASLAGVFVGKLVLRGKVMDAHGRSTELEIDGAIMICPFQGRYYLSTGRSLLADAADAVESASPQAFTPAMPDNPPPSLVQFVHLFPKRTAQVWWNIEGASAAPASEP